MKKLVFSFVVAIALAFAAPLSSTILAATTDSGPELVDPTNPYADYNWRYVTYSTYITSTYLDPSRSEHLGFDIDTGYHPAYAVDSASVIYSGVSSSAGKWIVLQTDDGSFTTRYLHLDERWVSTGESVSRGEQIGVTGTTGNSTGTHLHFDVNTAGVINGSQLTRSNTINPEYFFPYRDFIYGDSPSYIYTQDNNSTTNSFDYNKNNVSSTTNYDKYYNTETSFPDYLIEHVGESEFWDWFNSLSIEERTMDKFKKDFALTEKEIKEIKNSFINKNG